MPTSITKAFFPTHNDLQTEGNIGLTELKAWLHKAKNII